MASHERADAPAVLSWDFPLPRTHTGILLGNGVQGLMVWGVDTLNITVGRAGFWDHRGGNPFTSRTTYAEVRALLEAGDEAGLRRVFANPAIPEGAPHRPTQIGGGRLELRFAGGLRPLRGELETASATLHVTLAGPQGASAVLTIRQAIDQELAWVELDADAPGPPEVALVPTWDYVGAELARVGCRPPEPLDSPSGGGFCQRLPEDDPLALAWELRAAGGRAAITIATALGASADARAQALARAGDLAGAAARADQWWRDYWRGLPRVSLPDPALQHAWDYGVYKLAGLSTPGGVPAALQGPWMEEYQLPPWSNDYHFNINVQMVYWPCLAAGRFEHFWPLWDMIRGWMPQLRANGAQFFGAEGALLMPHSVDDRCSVVGTFWTGMIDQACAAWMGQMAWLHYRYSLDERVLRELAWPLLAGAFDGYWAMLEHLPTGQLSLPVSVSPEYNGEGMDAWGRDASFQLAALHFLAQTLPLAAGLLGQPEDPRWARVRGELPPYTLAGPPGQPRIGLWQGQDLDESHRHHSHLGAIYPFRTIDPRDPAHAEVVGRSVRHWVLRGAGAWSGWCLSWASILCARNGMPDAAAQWLRWWADVFTNEGHGTLHNASFPGCSTIYDERADSEVMQMDAGMGVLTAIQELLVQCHGDTIVVLPGLPRSWRALAFDGVWAEGAFRVGATVAGGRVAEVRVEATRGGRLRLAHGIDGAWECGGERGTGPLLERDTRPGERLTLLGGRG